MNDEKQEEFTTRPWSEMRAELREIHGPGFDRQVRLEGVWFDTSQEIASRPPEEDVDPTLRAASIAGRMDAIGHTMILDDPAPLRAQLIGLAADVVEWVEQIDAAKEES